MEGLQAKHQTLITPRGEIHVVRFGETLGDTIERLYPAATEKVGENEHDLIDYVMSRGWIIIENQRHNETSIVMTKRWPTSEALDTLRILIGDINRNFFVQSPSNRRPVRVHDAAEAIAILVK